MTIYYPSALGPGAGMLHPVIAPGRAKPGYLGPVYKALAVIENLQALAMWLCPYCSDNHVYQITCVS